MYFVSKKLILYRFTTDFMSLYEIDLHLTATFVYGNNSKHPLLNYSDFLMSSPKGLWCEVCKQ